MKKICVVTSGRADYGLLFYPIKKIAESQQLKLQLVVTGSHLSKNFGYTVKKIRQDQLKITATVPILEKSPELTLSKTITNFTKALKKLKPDLVLLLGDRFEILGVAEACLLLNIPVGHIHGGEITEGAIDDSIRHALTKLSHLHFTSNENHRQRVIQLGEDPKRVFTVGAPGLDFIKNTKLLTKKELSQKLQFSWQAENFLVTYHPETLKKQNEGKIFSTILKVLSTKKNTNIFITFPNFDPGYENIIKEIRKISGDHENIFIFQSLGQLNYLSLMQHCSGVIGNSSSGIIEAPFLGIKTLNIGERQKGRTTSSAHVFHAKSTANEIRKGLKLLLSSPPAKASSSLYGKGDAAAKIVKILEKKWPKGITMKRFYDLKK